MFDRRAVLILGALLAPFAAGAAEIRRYASANFAAAQETGAPVLVHIDATWCPTCRAQKPVIAKLLAESKFAAFKAFFVDFDSEKPVMRELAAPDRSTIIVFAKGREIARSTGETGEDAIAALMAKAL